MEFRILGPLEAYDDEGVQLDLGGPRPRTVLARLLLAGGALVSADTLIDDLYAGSPPASALASLQSYMSNLRRVIEPGRDPRTPPRLLVGRPPGYLLATRNVDAIRFTELIAGAESAPPGKALASVNEALRLWRGEPYGASSDAPWAVADANRLRELRLVAIERRAQALLDLDRPQAVILDLEVESAANPLRERLWSLLALALYRTGRQGDALAALRRARDLLADQLGLDPGPELRALEHDILRHAESLTVPPSPAAAARAPAPRRLLVGRERQLAELKTLPVRAGREGVTLAAVTGEPGIGKTCLLEAFRDHCANLGYVVLWGSCHHGEGAPALMPWLQILRALEEVSAPPDRRALAGLLDDDKPEDVTAAALLDRNHAIARWLAATARTQPLAIVLDDLHAADPASLELLRDVAVPAAGETANVPLTIVMAFRETAFPEAAGHHLSLNDVLGQLARHDVLRIRLTGLGADDVRAIAAAMGAKVDEPAAARLCERTGGNPFFVRESARLLAQGREMEAVPQAVTVLIRWWLGRLGARVSEVLGVAALLGRHFDPGVVAEVCQASEPGPAEVYDALDRAAQAGLVVSGGATMAFAHDLVRETIVQGIPPLRRVTIHQAVMTSLSRRPGVDVSVIAHHAVEAGPAAYAEAARWARAAAEQAGLLMAYEDAAAWWGRAVAAHGACAGDPAEYVELLLRQVSALLEAGDPIGAREARARAVRAAERTGASPELTAHALTALDAPAIWTPRDPYGTVELRLVDRFEAALRALPEGDRSERALLLGAMAHELPADDPRGGALSAEAVAMARRLDDPHLLMRVLNARHLALPQPLHIPELLELAEEMHELALRTRTPGFELLAQMMSAHHRLELSDLPGADAAAARCDAMLERLSLPWPRFQHTLWRINRLTLAGRFGAAEALYDDVERQAARIGVWHADRAVTFGRLLAHYHRGTLAEAELPADLADSPHPSAGHDLRVLHLCALDRREEARALAADGRPAPPPDFSWLAATCLQAAAWAAVGDVAACRVSYAALLPYSGRVAAVWASFCMGPVDWYLALLATALGDHPAAVRHLEALAGSAGRSGLAWWRDRALAALRDAASPGERPSGDPPLDLGPRIPEQDIERGFGQDFAQDFGRDSERGSGQGSGKGLGQEPGLVGRGAESELLRRAIVADGHRVVLVAGEPGIGKTSLAEDAARHAARVVSGRCWYGTGAPPFWPWTQVVRQLSGRHGELAEMVGATGEFALYDAFVRLVAHSGPVLVILDDLQWADASSLRLLELLATTRSCPQLTVIATYRDTEVGDPLARTLATLVRLPHVERIMLDGLGTEPIAQYLRRAGADAARAAEVARLTGGNPFFLGEVVHLGDEAPAAVADVLRGRLAAMPPGAADVLSAAALLGRDAQLDVLLDVVDGPRDEVLEVLDAAVQARLLTERDLVYRFAHDIVRDVLRDGLAPLRRRRLHARIAAALERRGTHVAELAYHYREGLVIAGMTAKAIEYARRAAAHAVAQFAYEDAVEHLRQALTPAGQLPSADRELTCDLLMELAEAQSAAGLSAQVHLSLRRAAEIADDLGDDERLARAALGFSDPLAWGMYEEWAGGGALTGRIERALRAHEGADSPWRSQLLAASAVNGFFARPVGESVALAAEAVRHARRRGDDRSLLRGLSAYEMVSRGAATHAERQAAIDEMLEVARRTGDLVAEWLAREAEYFELVKEGETALADPLLAWLAETARRIRQPALLSITAWLSATRAYLGGDLDRALAEAEESARVHPEGVLGRDDGAVRVRLFHCLAARLRGEAAEALSLAEQALEVRPGQAGWLVLRCAALLDLGKRDEAADVFAGLARDGFAGIEGDLAYRFIPDLLSETCLRLATPASLAHSDGPGRSEGPPQSGEGAPVAAQAMALYDRLLPHAGRLLGWSVTDLCLGRLALARGDHAAAGAHLRAALAFVRRSSAALYERPILDLLDGTGRPARTASRRPEPAG
ncbi:MULTISPECIES: AAA family ATPase [Streptosporangium]|uniref:ATPase/DNA-binding SARP family transcriptional activator n=1 Tax=Streptosporangium brasiliense TaxID=47480 RepID=A0ABT9RFA0_9ACTN|nr:AAA family ATPase [Streptosporangium brasiliense]MDP9867941.1 putative ATPase/DNA-binding SARP family transcriptional activator [Streptosporangium brasiliense]